MSRPAEATTEPRTAVGASVSDPTTGAAARQRQVGRAARGSSALAWGCALFAVVCVLVAGNQAAANQVITGSEQAVVLDTRQLITALGQAFAGAPTIQLPYATPPINEFNAPEGLRYWERRDMVAEFNDWWPSRALWDDIGKPPDVERRYAITEFPFFSFWLGDMHPHVMSLPFTLLALALALATLARRGAPAFAENRRGWLELALTGVVLGGLYMINSWDLPTYLLLYAGALFLLYVRLAAGKVPLWQQLGRNLLLAVLAAFLLYLPFHLTFHSLVGAKEPLIALPLIGRLTSTLGIFSDDRTALSYFLVIFGLFLVPLLAFVFGQGGGRSQRTPLGITSARDTNTLRSWLSEITLVATFIAFGLGLGIDFPLLALLPLGMYASWTALRANSELGILTAEFKRSGEAGSADAAAMTLLGSQEPGLRRAAAPVQNSTGVSFALWAAAMGCFICFGTELIYIRDVFEGWQPRFNTIFKFYYQTWLIWGTLAGFALWWVLSYTRRAIALPVAALTLILLLGGLVYPALTAGKLPSRDNWKGLEGTTPRESSPEGRAAIAWLRANAPIGAVVLEAVGGSYNGEGFAGISASTGIPTVIGWPGHQSQWRGGDQQLLDQLTPRENDVRTIYTTSDVELARTLLQQYGVSYIFVGDQERQAYGVEGEAKFASLGESVFQQGSVIIYKIR